MTDYNSYGDLFLLLCGALFVAAIGELALGLYLYTCTEDFKKSLPPIAFFSALILLISLVMGGKPDFIGNIWWFVFVALLILSLTHIVSSFIKGYKISKMTISSDSVRQAMNGFNFGICFTDDNGRLVLINQEMNKLMFSLSGKYPQSLNEIIRVIEGKTEKIEFQEQDDYSLYRFPDGSVWKVTLTDISEKELEGFKQITAQDMTDLYTVNQNLHRENGEIRAAIAKMDDLITRMSELARQQEALNLKMRVHDEIGASLITLSRLANGEIKADAKEQISALKEALSYFGTSNVTGSAIDEKIGAFASKLGVKLIFEGEFSKNKRIANLVNAAIKECITNCVRHAKGNEVRIVLSRNNYVYMATITNNGEAPKSGIHEGTGLSALREKIEGAGGEMTVSAAKVFTLQLVFDERKVGND